MSAWRASPTSALLSLLKFAGMPNGQASTPSPSVHSPIAFRQVYWADGVRLVRSAYQVDEVRFVSRLLVYEVRLSASFAREAP